MPRKPRMYLGGMPCHVIQRGNNRAACFYADDDYEYYLSALGDACRRYGVDLHAYALMTNHAHMLFTPQDQWGVSRVMQSLGRRYVQHINKAHQRTGTLWEGRHKSSLVDADNYLLACYRYIELNPVRAAMVVHPAEYRWSSHRCNAYGEANELITPHDLYQSLGGNIEHRRAHYSALFETPLNKLMMSDIRAAANRSMPLGDNRFREQIEHALGRKLGNLYQGRSGRKRNLCART